MEKQYNTIITIYVKGLYTQEEDNMNTVGLTYTKEMEEQDVLYDNELNDIEITKALQKDIVLEAISKSWKGSFLDIPEYGIVTCKELISQIESDLNKVLYQAPKSYKINVLNQGNIFIDLLEKMLYVLNGRVYDVGLEPINILNFTTLKSEKFTVVIEIEIPKGKTIYQYFNDNSLKIEEVSGTWHMGCFYSKHVDTINKEGTDMKGIKLTYTEEMRNFDELNRHGGDIVEASRLREQIINEAISNGWKGLFKKCICGGELMTKIYLNEEMFIKCEKGKIINNCAFFDCLGLLEYLEKELNKETDKKSLAIEMAINHETKNYKIQVLSEEDIYSDISYILYNLHGRPNLGSVYEDDNLEPVRSLNMTLQMNLKNKEFELIIEVTRDYDISKYLNAKDIYYKEVFGNWSFGVFTETYNHKIDTAINYITEKNKTASIEEKEVFDTIIEALKSTISNNISVKQ